VRFSSTGSSISEFLVIELFPHQIIPAAQKTYKNPYSGLEIHIVVIFLAGKGFEEKQANQHHLV
jgi:hypothetical protein